ncbi:MAG: DMT family transporter [Marinilabiliaceae bacterium]|nr:DMT family transporter [Marinilabiliaceae bacterium]
MVETNRSVKASLALLTGLCIIGFSAILIKLAEAPGLVTAFYRVGVGSLVLLIPFFSRLKSIRQNFSAKGMWMAVLGGVCFGIDTGLWSIGIELSNASLPTLMANLAPAWVGIGALLLFKEKQRPGFWVGLLITFAGIIIMVNRNLLVADGLSYGIGLGVLAGIFYAAYYLFTQQGRALMNTMTYLSVSTFAAAITLAIIVLFTNYSFVGYSQTTWLIFIVYGAGVHVVGWTFINYAQGYLKATTVSPTLLGQPVITAIAAFFILGEVLTTWQIIGGIIVFGGIYIVNITWLKRK